MTPAEPSAPVIAATGQRTARFAPPAPLPAAGHPWPGAAPTAPAGGPPRPPADAPGTPADPLGSPGATGPRGAEALAVLHRSARSLLGRLPELTDRVVVLIHQRVPAYRPPASDPEALWQEVHRSLRHSVGSLLHPGEPREAARRCTWRIGVDRAGAGVPLDAVLHAFRIGGSVVWEQLLATTARLDPERTQLLVHVASDIWRFVDQHCALLAAAYHRTERQRAWQRVNRRRLMVRSLLDGTTRVAELPEVAEALGLPEEGRYAVVLRSGPRPTGHRRPPEPSQPPPPPGMRWLWQGVPDDSGAPERGGAAAIVLLGEGALEDLVSALHPGPGGRVGVSSAVAGLASVGEAHRLARTALRTAPADGRVALLPEHLPAALVVSSPELGAALTERALGPVLRLEPADRELLLDTLSVWLECDGSAPRAATRLCCHRNTVLNRLRRYERLTGRSLARPGALVELSLALTARTLTPV